MTCENYTYLQAQEEASLGECCSDTLQYAPSKSSHTAKKSCEHGNETESYQSFQSLETSGRLMGNHGEKKLTSLQEDSRARTLVPQEKAQELTESEADCGARCTELSVKYDLDSHSWKIVHSLFPTDLPESLVNLPKSGIACAGIVLNAHHTELTKREDVFMVWPTPCHGTNRWNGTFQEVGGSQNKLRNTWLGRQKVNPQWWEWLMDWPIGWADLEPLETDRFRQWQQQHSEFCHKD